MCTQSGSNAFSKVPILVTMFKATRNNDKFVTYMLGFFVVY